jgi:hypothetical protein
MPEAISGERPTGQSENVIDIAEFLARFPVSTRGPNPIHSAAPGLVHARGQRDRGMLLAFEVRQRFLEMIEKNPDMFDEMIRSLA